jgi:hypothetical protein
MWNFFWNKESEMVERLMLPENCPKIAVPDDSPANSAFSAQFVHGGAKVRVFCDCGCFNTYDMRYRELSALLATPPQILMQTSILDACQRPDQECQYDWIEADTCCKEFLRDFQSRNGRLNEFTTQQRTAAEPAV